MKENHSFYNTIVNSPEWSAWYEEQGKRMRAGKIFKNKFVSYAPVFDIDESSECDLLSENHWNAFVNFLRKKTFIKHRGKIK